MRRPAALRIVVAILGLVVLLPACSEAIDVVLPPETPAVGDPQEYDDPPPVPGERLDDATLVDLLRSRSSVVDAPERCTPGEVSARLVGFDMALGHRFSTLRVRNDATRPCVVEGVPGVGARGEEGSVLQVSVSRVAGSPEARPVLLTPGDEASARVEWTGALAGAESERAGLLVFQLAESQTPLPVPAVIDRTDDGLLDIGTNTLVRVGAFLPGE